MAASENVTLEIEQLRKDMETLRSDLGSLLTAFKGLGTEQGRAAVDRAREMGESVAGQARSTQENLERCIEERPVTSVLIAGVSGFVVGMLLGHRR